MENYNKISSTRLYNFWKHLSIGLLVVIAMIGLSHLFPYFFSPIIALLAAAVLYTMVYNNKINNSPDCMLIISALLYSTVIYSFFSILVNILDLWNFLPFKIPKELSFFNNPYLPTLYLNPICFFTLLFCLVRRRKILICVHCRLARGEMSDRGKLGNIYEHESKIQLENLTGLFGILSVAVWVYYIFFFVDADLNGRDNYIFAGLDLIAFGLDELYFIYRYYNLYLDLKDNNEIISEEEAQEMSSRTSLRFYVICGDYMYLDFDCPEPRNPSQKVIDTPFTLRRNVSGITVPEVNAIIRKQTGVRDGDMRFFFGRKNRDVSNHNVMRYFYYLDGKPEDYPDLNVKGQWVDFDTIKKIYSYHPEELSSIFVADITRMATIILTQKIFDENGFRKNKLKSYRPSFNLLEVRKNRYDFQDDKWIRISLFNSDTKLYRFKRWWRGERNHQPKKSAR